MYQFEKLTIWQESVILIKKVYQITGKFPKEERYSLSSQIQRAVVSISLNIAEGKGSSYDKEFARFLNISLRSLHETVAALLIACELGYVSKIEIVDQLEELEKLGGKIKSLINKLKANGQQLIAT